MDTDPRQQIEQRMAELPEDIKEAVLSSQLGEHLRAIGQKHNLHVDQIGALEDEAMLVMLGFFEPESFSEQIARELNIPLADATAIASEVNEQAFLPIRESMKRFTEARRSEIKPVLAEPAQTPVISPVTAPTGFAQAPVAPPPPATTQPNPITPPSAPITTGFGQVAAMPKPPIPQAQPAPVSIPPTSPAPMSTAEQMLTEPTVAKPIYKADPYREPLE
jgi:hypothetical protein